MILLQPSQGNLSFYLETANKYGMGFEAMDFAFPCTLDDPEKLSYLHEAYKDAPLVSCHGVFADINYSGSDPFIYGASVRRLRQCIETVLEFGIKKFVFHSCFHPVLKPDDSLYKVWNKKAAGLFSSLTKEYGIKIYLENVLDKTPEILVGMMKEANHPDIHMCFDVGHANLSDCTLAQWLEAIHPYMGCLHLSDNLGKYDDHMALGTGTVDWLSLTKLLPHYEVQADYTIEVNGIENVTQSIHFLKANCGKLWGEMVGYTR